MAVWGRAGRLISHSGPGEVQFLIACQDVALQVFLRMLVVAIIEAAMTLSFFMHLWDNRGLKLGAFR
jgi:hypothetical protein